MPKCPICGRQFKTSRGLLQHMRRSHEEYLTSDPFERFAISLRKSMKPRKRRKGGLFGW